MGWSRERTQGKDHKLKYIRIFKIACLLAKASIFGLLSFSTSYFGVV